MEIKFSHLFRLFHPVALGPFIASKIKMSKDSKMLLSGEGGHRFQCLSVEQFPYLCFIFPVSPFFLSNNVSITSATFTFLCSRLQEAPRSDIQDRKEEANLIVKVCLFVLCHSNTKLCNSSHF